MSTEDSVVDQIDTVVTRNLGVADKVTLLAPRLTQDEVSISGVGVVRVRALTRAQVAQLGNKDGLETERLALSMGMVDPQLTPEEVGQWQASAPAMEIQPVLTRINELSGLTKRVQKEMYEAFRDRSGS